MREPLLRVALSNDTRSADLVLESSREAICDGRSAGTIGAGEVLHVQPEGELLALRDGHGNTLACGFTVGLVSRHADASTFVLKGMTVGSGFHWQRDEDLRFSGDLSLERRGRGFDVINEVPLESYLRSVISSEMNARCPEELLRAHAVISRSWVLAQLESTTVHGGPSGLREERGRVVEIRRWYHREDHQHFDVCADDHCQRYQGLTRVSSSAAAAVGATRGIVLMHRGRVCDARFSKCCGGMTERFSAAWGDADLPYLQPVADCAQGQVPFRLPLTEEGNAEAFLFSSPSVWCNRADPRLLERILPEVDHSTDRFFRWRVDLHARTVRRLIIEKLGIDPGPVRNMYALHRGDSGRIVCLAIVGRRFLVRVGKELEIRRVLSPTHLYSSAFVVRREGEVFHLHGGGWGHGVGLCQVGAAVMAERGYDHMQILAHYYPSASLQRVY